jgi:hypothetical protein
VVVTSRDYEVAVNLVGVTGVLTKKPMGPSDAEAVFKNNYPNGKPYNNVVCGQLLHELRYLPLAVTQVAKYLETNRRTITPSQYLTRFKSKMEDRKALRSKAVHNPWRIDSVAPADTETVLTAFGITFRQIRVQSPLADLILQMISCINREKIPQKLIACVDGGDDEIKLGEALGRLDNFSLLQVTGDEAGKCYTAHTLVHIALQEFLTPKKKISRYQRHLSRS